MQSMYPDIYDQLLTYVEYGVHTPKFGKIETKAFGSVKGPTVGFTEKIWITNHLICNLFSLSLFSYKVFY